MITFKRDPHNPLLSPDPAHPWEAEAAFNGCIVKESTTYHLVYRALSKMHYYEGADLQLSVVGAAESTDGVSFTNRRPFLEPEEPWEMYGCEDPRITFLDGTYYIFYTALSAFPPAPHGIKVAVAMSSDMKTVRERHLVTPFNAKAMVLFPKKIHGMYTALLTIHTDIPPARICLVQFDAISDLWSDAFWRDWYLHWEDHALPLQRMNSAQIEVGAPPVETEHGWFFVYAYISNYFTERARTFTVEGVLLDSDKPQQIIGRIHESLLTPEKEYEKFGVIPDVVFPTGALVENETFHLYYGGADTTCCRASIPLKDIYSQIQTSSPVALKLHKYEFNPILEPVPTHHWEAQAVFNPAVVYDDGRIHIVYRAMSPDNTSSMGYAVSDDGYTIDERMIEPVYQPRAPFEDKQKQGVGSGCEDPRMTLIGDRYYMLYTAYDGVNPPRVAMTSILRTDFLREKWMWEPPILISPPGTDDKDAALFPQQINGKYVFFHRINNEMVLDYRDSLTFKENEWLEIKDSVKIRDTSWEGAKVGLNTVPIKSRYGWFVLYHGVSSIDREYRLGGLLLDLEHPVNVLAATDYPILEPTTLFERKGIVDNVVFPCGNIVKDGILFVYYGGADRVIGVATIPFEVLLTYLLQSQKKTYLL